MGLVVPLKLCILIAYLRFIKILFFFFIKEKCIIFTIIVVCLDTKLHEKKIFMLNSCHNIKLIIYH